MQHLVTLALFATAAMAAPRPQISLSPADAALSQLNGVLTTLAPCTQACFAGASLVPPFSADQAAAFCADYSEISDIIQVCLSGTLCPNDTVTVGSLTNVCAAVLSPDVNSNTLVAQASATSTPDATTPAAPTSKKSAGERSFVAGTWSLLAGAAVTAMLL